MCQLVTPIISYLGPPTKSVPTYQLKVTTLEFVLVRVITLRLIFEYHVSRHLISYTLAFKYKAPNI